MQVAYKAWSGSHKYREQNWDLKSIFLWSQSSSLCTELLYRKEDPQSIQVPAWDLKFL